MEVGGLVGPNLWGGAPSVSMREAWEMMNLEWNIYLNAYI